MGDTERLGLSILNEIFGILDTNKISKITEVSFTNLPTKNKKYLLESLIDNRLIYWKQKSGTHTGAEHWWSETRRKILFYAASISVTPAAIIEYMQPANLVETSTRREFCQAMVASGFTATDSATRRHPYAQQMYVCMGYERKPQKCTISMFVRRSNGGMLGHLSRSMM